jgi:serine/threonine-protein kinase RsbW
MLAKSRGILDFACDSILLWPFDARRRPAPFDPMPERESEEDLTEQTQLESTLKSVDTAETIVLHAAKEAGFDEDGQHQIGMAVRECMVNAVVHGNRYSAHKKVHLAITSLPNGIAVTIGDEGSGFDVDSLPDPLAPENLLRQSGRGILLIRAFMDEVDLHPRPGGGTEVRLVKHFNKQ